MLLAPPFLSVPPVGYGGTERVVASLAAVLPRLGWGVEVFAAGHPETPIRKPVGLASVDATPERTHVAAALRALRTGRLSVDLIHDHTRTAALRAGLDGLRPMLTTVHNDVDEERRAVYRGVSGDRLAFLSRAQAARYDRSDACVIPNGMEMADWPLHEGPRGKHLVFLGRLSREKGPHHAVDIATSLGVPLIVAGGRDPAQQAFFLRELAPRLRGQDAVRWLGEVRGPDRWHLLSRAMALLAPLAWDEPFGLVLLEAMACGTPVLVTDRGAAGELVTHRRSGWLVRSPSEWAQAVAWARQAQPREVRAAVREAFSAERMARQYVSRYEALLAEGVGREHA